MTDREVLRGGVGNAGLVVRVGDQVSRPSGPHTATIHALLRHVRGSGFDGVPDPLGVDADGREWLGFIAGDVPVPPYPEWARTDDALASVAALLRRFHDATEGFDGGQQATWDRELAGTTEGEVIGHHDVCLENVVFRDGRAVALLDFDFAAPGTRAWDVASLVRMCVPIDDPGDAARLGWHGGDPFRRLDVVTAAYGSPLDRREVVDLLQVQTRAGGWFVRRRVDAGHPAFVAMWNATGGAARYDRRRNWFEANRQRFLDRQPIGDERTAGQDPSIRPAPE
jgi:hypothetical protein